MSFGGMCPSVYLVSVVILCHLTFLLMLTMEFVISHLLSCRKEKSIKERIEKQQYTMPLSSYSLFFFNFYLFRCFINFVYPFIDLIGFIKYQTEPVIHYGFQE